jgi:hypothetical protein
LHSNAASTTRRGRWNLEQATQFLLTQDGDDRIRLGPDGLNRYGCAPRPDAGLLSLGSCTASVISERGFAAACELHSQLRTHSHRAAEMSRQLRADVLQLSGAAHVEGTQVLLAASGTDIHRLTLNLVQSRSERSVRCLMVDPSETGAGVPQALHGRGPADTVALRHPDTRPRSIQEIDADFSALAQAAVARGECCLLILTDTTKTGLIAPSLDCALGLRQSLGSQVEVMVDACQFRLAPHSLCAYLESGFSVAITGSKFVTGPTFCGALLLPRAWQTAGSQAPQTPPAGWGLLLRWAAALAELRAFRQVPAALVHWVLQDWGQAVTERLTLDPHFSAVQVPALERPATGHWLSWDSLPTVFCLRLRQLDSAKRWHWLGADETRDVQRKMGEIDAALTWASTTPGALATRFQIGQAVTVGQADDGQALLALRLCMDARWISQAAATGRGAEQAIAHTLLALDKMAWLAQNVAPTLNPMADATTRPCG